MDGNEDGRRPWGSSGDVGADGTREAGAAVRHAVRRDQGGTSFGARRSVHALDDPRPGSLIPRRFLARRPIVGTLEPAALHLLPDTAVVGSDGSLSVGGCSMEELAADLGTPLFVYDEDHVRARCREAVAALGAERVVYATKAFLCRAMARLAHEEGLAPRRRHGRRAARRPGRRGAGGELARSTATTRASASYGRRSTSGCATSWSTASTSSTVSTRCTCNGADDRRTCCCASRRASRRTPTSTWRPARTTPKFGFGLANGDAAAAVERAHGVARASSSACTATSAPTCSPSTASPGPPR